MNRTKEDKRKGRPSASAAKANRLCNGRHKMCLPIKDTESPAAAAGTLAHLYMEDDTIKIPDDMLSACEEAKSQRDHLVGMVWADWETNPPELHLEERLWYRKDRYSGKADWIGIRDKKALIIDYKFGRIAVDKACQNDQLVWLAVLVFTNFNVDRITVAIVQPYCGPVTLHTYEVDDLQRLRWRVLSIVRRIDQQHAPLRAGPAQCKYCKAIHVCPAIEGKRDAIARIDEQQMTTLTNAHLVSMLDAVPAVRTLCEKIEGEAVSRLQSDPRAIRGYELIRSKGRRGIKDVNAAVLRLLAAGVIDAEGIAAASSLQVGKLQRVMQEYNEVGLKEAREIIEEVIGDGMTVTEGKVKACRIES